MITRNEELSNVPTEDLQFHGETGRVRYQPDTEYHVIPTEDTIPPLRSTLFYDIAEQQNKEWQRPSLEPTPLTNGYALEGEAHTETSAASDSGNHDTNLYRLEDSSWSQAS